MADADDKNTWTYRAREAVGVFPDPDALEAAVSDLEVSGFDRAAISVLGTNEAVKERIGHYYRQMTEIEDNPRVPQSAFDSEGASIEGEAAAIAFPLYIGGVAGAVAVVASGGALAAAVVATLLGGSAGAGLGALLAYAIARHHADRIEKQLDHGGLVLWVGVPDEATEKRAVAILKKTGAQHVHVHEIQREWGPKDRPLAEQHLDVFLERERSS